MLIFQGKPDVRMAYIQFVLSFLMSGDNTTIGQILEAKGINKPNLRALLIVSLNGLKLLFFCRSLDFLSEILTNGLKEDRLSIVNLILSTLQTRVRPFLMNAIYQS